MLLDDKCDSCTEKKANNAEAFLRRKITLTVVQVIGFIFYPACPGIKKNTLRQSEVKFTALEIR